MVSIAYPEAQLYYQPQVTSDGQSIVGLECLLRSVSSCGKVSGPGKILESIKNVSEADALDWWVIEEALGASVRWPHLKIAINISARQFQSPDFVKRLSGIFSVTGAIASQVELELLEDGLISHFERAVETMNQVRFLGLTIALDDFGTGYSSLSYLQKLPIDKLKLDKSLVDGVGELKSAAIVQAVTALARSLGLKVVAEGVETLQQQQFLRISGCHLLQGYLFSPAVNAQAIDSMLERGWPARA